jgi:ATP-dependent DNA ligase
MVMLQPVSGLYIVEEFVKSVGIEDGYDKFDKAVHERTGFHLSEQSPLKHVKSVTGPTLVAQVHDDTMTRARTFRKSTMPSQSQRRAFTGWRAPTAASTATTSSVPTPNFRSSGSTHQLT